MSSEPAQLDPPGFTYFFDSTNMVRPLADALHQRGRLVHMHKQVFPDRTPDRVWIPEVTRRGWIILTRDKHLQTRHLEWMAFLRAKARVLWFRGDRASDIEITEGFLAALSKIDRLTAALIPPFIIKITPAGHVEQIYPEPESAATE